MAPRGLDPLVAPPRRGNDRLPPRIDDGDELFPQPFPQPAIIEEGPTLLAPPRRVEEVPMTMPAGETTVRMIPSAANVEPLEIHVIELKNAAPAAMALHVKKFFDTAEVSIDEDTGSLVIRCGKKTLDDIKKLVEKLDKPSKRGGMG